MFQIVGKSPRTFYFLLCCFSTHLFKLLLYGSCSVKAQHIALEKYFVTLFVEKLRQDNSVDMDCVPDESICWCVLHSLGALILQT